MLVVEVVVAVFGGGGWPRALFHRIVDRSMCVRPYALANERESESAVHWDRGNLLRFLFSRFVCFLFLSSASFPLLLQLSRNDRRMER